MGNYFFFKKNIKKLLLSAALGMFCYCTNNAAMDQPAAVGPQENNEINKVLTVMLQNQLNIFKAKEEIKKYEKSIYSQINEDQKVTKKQVLGFIEKQITSEEKAGEMIKNDIKILGQYFHLEEIKEDNDECKVENLTEIFWNNGEEGENAEINNDEVKGYFQAIINAENAISKAFKEYYEAKKTKKEAKNKENMENMENNVENVENVENVVIEEIMKECCGEEQGDDLVTKFIGKLRKIDLKEIAQEINEEVKQLMLEIIEKRITLSKEKEPREKDFISFLKQKIGEEEKKEEKKEEIKEGDKLEDEDIHPAKKGVCPCCNC